MQENLHTRPVTSSGSGNPSLISIPRLERVASSLSIVLSLEDLERSNVFGGVAGTLPLNADAEHELAGLGTLSIVVLIELDNRKRFGREKQRHVD